MQQKYVTLVQYIIYRKFTSQLVAILKTEEEKNEFMRKHENMYSCFASKRTLPIHNEIFVNKE